VSNQETFTLIIRTRQEVIYDGNVQAISSVNGKGPFDVLPHHAFFISLIERYLIVHEQKGKDRRFNIDTGVLHVEEGKVHIYLENYIPT
jgi:F0F1-type ATP synthase epsilon subunit